MVRLADDNLARRGRDGTKQRRARRFPRGQDLSLLALEIPGGVDGLIIADMSLVLKDYDLIVGDLFLTWRVPPETRLVGPGRPWPGRKSGASN